MSIENEARLVYSMDSQQLSVSPGQSFALSGVLDNVGRAGIGPDSTVLISLDTLGTGFTFTGGDSANRRLDLGSGSSVVSWDLQAPLSVDTVALYARVSDPVAYDINKYVDSLVVLQQGEDSTVVTIVAGGAVAITNIRLITPPGAVDDTISTSQSFTLEGAFSFVGSVVV
jgi:hypothetical protein